ncbi:MAG TPA: PIN domain-containing protein [Allosphingosinicella sp.]|nr:PIN domain-containing protein [Allosphingosinicella sp.]
MRFTLDSNVLVYAVDAGAGERHAFAAEVLARAATSDAILTTQAVGEFLSVVRRKNPSAFSAALGEVGRWATIFPIAPTTCDHVIEAAAMAERFRLQLWDCVIWRAARSNGASVFVSEDLQDGFSTGGMTVLNPFNSKNAEVLAALLGIEEK